MIRTSGTGYNYCSEIPVTPSCVGQTTSDFYTCGLRRQNSIPVKCAHMYFWREAYQTKCTSPRFLNAKYGMSEPDDWLFTDWHAPSHTACQFVTFILTITSYLHETRPVYDLCFILTKFRSAIKVLMIYSLTYATFETCSKRRTHWILTFHVKHKKKPLSQWQPLIWWCPKKCRQTAMSGAVLE